MKMSREISDVNFFRMYNNIELERCMEEIISLQKIKFIPNKIAKNIIIIEMS